MAVFELQTRATGAGIVTAHSLLYVDGHTGALLTVGGKLRRIVGPKLRWIVAGGLNRAWPAALRSVGKRDVRPEKEGQHSLVKFLQHLGE